MHPVIRSIAAAVVSTAGLSAVAAPVAAADPFPSRPIRMVVPFAPGGGSDVIGRIVGSKLAELFSQSVVIDNRPGAAGMLGTDLVARAAPDGHTLLLADAALTINSAYYVRQPPPDPVKSFIGVALVVETPYILMVHPGLPAKDVKSLVAQAKAKPGEISIGSSGNGGGQHMTLELFRLRAGVDLNHIPYKGGGPVLTDPLAGRIQGAFIGMGPGLSQVQSGRLRPLAVTGSTRSKALPEVPTLTELGFEVAVSNWYGVVAPAATPRTVVSTLYEAIGRAIAAPEVRARLETAGFEPAAQSPGQFQRLIEAELQRWRQTIRDARIPTG